MGCTSLKNIHEAMISDDPQDVILMAIEILFLFLSHRLSDKCNVLVVDAALPRDSICLRCHLLKSETST